MPITHPSLAGFEVFVRTIMRIDPVYLPVDDPTTEYAYEAALSMVNPALAGWSGGRCFYYPGQPAQAQGTTMTIYARAVYNLGGSNLVNYAQDQEGRPFFEDLRAKLGINKFQMGIVSGTSDGGTATSLLNPEFMRELTLANLQQLKDPWGRAYLAIAQDYGSLWGIS